MGSGGNREQQCARTTVAGVPRQPALLSDAQGAVIVCPGDRTPGVRCAGALDLRDELTLVCAGCGQEYSVVHEIPHLAWGDRQPPIYARLGYVTYHDHHFAGFTEPPESSERRPCRRHAVESGERRPRSERGVLRGM